MIHHISIDAKNPQRVATVLAEILEGQVLPAPPNFRPDSWFVYCGDQYGTMVEVMPAATMIWPDETEASFKAGNTSQVGYVPVHAYISVQVSADKLKQIGEREGWLTRVCDRGPFDLVEVWIENRQLIEFAPPEMSQKYLQLLTNPDAVKAVMAELMEVTG